VQRDSVTKVAHDVVTVEPETEDDGSTTKGTVDTSQRLSRKTNRIGTYRTQSGTGDLLCSAPVLQMR